MHRIGNLQLTLVKWFNIVFNSLESFRNSFSHDTASICTSLIENYINQSIFYLHLITNVLHLWHNLLAGDLCKVSWAFLGRSPLIYVFKTFLSNTVALYIIKQQDYYTIYMFHYVEQVYFCWTNQFHFLFNNCSD